jgi:hypothetical protein
MYHRDDLVVVGGASTAESARNPILVQERANVYFDCRLDLVETGFADRQWIPVGVMAMLFKGLLLH